MGTKLTSNIVQSIRPLESKIVEVEQEEFSESSNTVTVEIELPKKLKAPKEIDFPKMNEVLKAEQLGLF